MRYTLQFAYIDAARCDKHSLRPLRSRARGATWSSPTRLMNSNRGLVEYICGGAGKSDGEEGEKREEENYQPHPKGKLVARVGSNV